MATGAVLLPKTRRCFQPKQTQPAPKKVVCSDCENITQNLVMWKFGPYHSNTCPGVVRGKGRTSTLIWPHFTWLNIENNYSNDDNEDLMTFISRSSECGLLWVRGSSNKWAVWRVLGRKGSWEVVQSSEYMVISSFGQFSGRLSLFTSQWPCINIITQQAQSNFSSITVEKVSRHNFYLKSINTQETWSDTCIAATQWLFDILCKRL